VEAFIETALSGQDMSSTFRHGGMSWSVDRLSDPKQAANPSIIQ
jgi:hypothetical protein